jgi:uncharacterized RDD family membrane protein YckC
MTRIRIALLAVLMSASVTAAAQVGPPPAPTPEAPPLPEQLPFPREPPDDFDVFGRGTRNAFRLGQDFRLDAGSAVRDAAVVFGDATIAGEVDGNLVVIFGNVNLASTAIVRGDFVAVGGTVTAAPGATARRDVVVVGGAFNAAPDFTPAGAVVIGGGMLGEWIQGFVPYLSRGLLWGRLIVPDLPWVWGVVAIFLLLYVAMNLVFASPVRAGAATLMEKPLTSFGTGLLVLLLVGPVCLLLAASVVGLAVVPFVFCALLGAWIIGKVAVARWIGRGVFEEDAADSRAQATRSVLVGFVLITIAYMIPVLGLAAWAIGGVMGLGASALAFLHAYRRENPREPSAGRAPDQAWRGWGSAYRRQRSTPDATVPDTPPPPVPTTYASEETAAEPAATQPPPASASFGFTEPPAAMAYESVSMAGGGAAAAALPLGAPPASVLATMPKAMFRDRLAAFVLDLVLMVIVINILRADPDEMFIPIMLAYHVGFWTWKQTTVGGIICQLRIVRVDGAPLSFADALVRGLASIFSLAVFFIGALWILRDPDSQAWHDKVAGTYVVKVPRGWPL